MKVRIIERILPNGNISYIIQKKILWIWWTAEEARGRHFHPASYRSLDAAKANLYRHNGSKKKERVAYFEDSI